MSRGDGEHQHDVAAYRRRPDSTPEHLHDLDPQPQIALIVADHAFTTEQQRAQMINVGMCAGSRSQRRGNALRTAHSKIRESGRDLIFANNYKEIKFTRS